MECGNKGILFNIQRYSVNDGPGIRTIVFLKGCPLACEWCSNPESQAANKIVVFHKGKCLGCGKCFEVCPTGARRRTDFSICEYGCGMCAKACPAGALEAIGREMSVEDVIEVVERDRRFYLQSGGGLTVSGGEPLMQPEFVYELCGHAQQSHINTAMETAGCAPWQTLERIASRLDYILYDLKHMEDEAHRRFTGISNRMILGNLEKLANMDARKIIVRIPLIMGVNADRKNLKETSGFLAGLGIREVHLLPYHRYGEGKYKKLNRPYRFEGKTPPDEYVEECIELFSRDGIHAGKKG